MGDSGNAPAASQVQGNAPAGSAAAGSSMDSATFNRLDQDKDGFITREEAAGSELANRFDELDRNHDGKLSPSELRASAATGSSRQDATGGYRGGPIEQDD